MRTRTMKEVSGARPLKILLLCQVAPLLPLYSAPAIGLTVTVAVVTLAMLGFSGRSCGARSMVSLVAIRDCCRVYPGFAVMVMVTAY